MPDKKITRVGLDVLEKAVDKLFAKVGIDVEFTRHFLDRVNDSRNKKQITIRELAFLFKKTYHKHGKSIAKLGPDIEAVLKDLETDINIPFALNWNRQDKELELVSKTVMRKPNFKTPDRQFKVESVNRGLDALGKKYRDAAESGDLKKADRIMKLIQNKSGKYGTSKLKKHKKSELTFKNSANESTLLEGVNDPGIFKAVFLAGGPGSGKSFLVGKAALTSFGLKVVNSDIAFEKQLKSAGMEMTSKNIFSPKGQAIRGRALQTTRNIRSSYLNGRLGMVIDGTGREYTKIARQAQDLKDLGYEVAMIFVDTDLHTAIERDDERKRTIGPKDVTRMWGNVQGNVDKFRKFFGAKNFITLDNSRVARGVENSGFLKKGEKMTRARYAEMMKDESENAVMSAYKKMGKWIKSPPKTPLAKKWIAAHKFARGITEEHGAGFEGSDKLVKNYVKGTPNQPALRYLKNRKKQKVEEGIFDNLGGKGLGGLITKAREAGKPYHKAVAAYKKAVDGNGSNSGRKKTHASLAASIAGMYDFHIRSFIKFLKQEIKTKRLDMKYDVGAITEDADSGATTTASIPDPAGLDMKKQLLGFRAYDKRCSMKKPPRVLKRPVPND